VFLTCNLRLLRTHFSSLFYFPMQKRLKMQFSLRNFTLHTGLTLRHPRKLLKIIKTTILCHLIFQKIQELYHMIIFPFKYSHFQSKFIHKLTQMRQKSPPFKKTPQFLSFHQKMRRPKSKELQIWLFAKTPFAVCLLFLLIISSGEECVQILALSHFSQH
jgi:hypothetical protein